jgi:hypothetical protein
MPLPLLRCSVHCAVHPPSTVNAVACQEDRLAGEISYVAAGLRFDLDIHIPNSQVSDGPEICIAKRIYGNTLWLPKP